VRYKIIQRFGQVEAQFLQLSGLRRNGPVLQLLDAFLQGVALLFDPSVLLIGGPNERVEQQRGQQDETYPPGNALPGVYDKAHYGLIEEGDQRKHCGASRNELRYRTSQDSPRSRCQPSEVSSHRSILHLASKG
jgi:hypothetical protein